jgi:polar amino acid transport system permease protein
MRLSSFIADFKLVFVDSERYMLVLEGLLVTLEITFFAVLIGIGLGTLVASIRSTYDKNEEALKKQGGLSFYVLFVANTICKIYLTVIRGTPTVV